MYIQMLSMSFTILLPFVCTFRANAPKLIKSRNTNQFCKEYNKLSLQYYVIVSNYKNIT